MNRVLRKDKSKRTLTGEAVTPEFFERSFFYEDLSDEENSKDVTDKDEDKTSEIKELTSRENYVLRARQWCTTL